MGLFSRKSKAGTNGNNPTKNASKKNTTMSRTNSERSRNGELSDVPLPKAPNPHETPSGYLRSIYAVRERSKLVLDKAKSNQLRHFQVDMSKFPDTANYVVSIIKVRCTRSRPDHSVV